MCVFAGTSGFSYPEWRGIFYPPEIRPGEMLAFYAQKLPAVEINNTFYRLPKPEVLQSWSAQVPEDFRFVLKAPRRITHIKRLKDAEEEVRYFLKTAKVLTDRLGCVLYQLPPFLRKDRARLHAFIELLPQTPKTAFEFRHPSWSDSEVLELLAERNFAWCVSDPESQTAIQELSNGSWGYLRLRQDHYTEDGLKSWAKTVRDQRWETAYVFFKHETDGPRLAERFLKLVEHR
ncbi:MAG: DUF72 domain-containing protein [Gammaproteobacteria bacterium]